MQTDPPPIGGSLTPTTDHCLVGTRGTDRGSTDGWCVHATLVRDFTITNPFCANFFLDTDVIIWEGDPEVDPFLRIPLLVLILRPLQVPSEKHQKHQKCTRWSRTSPSVPAALEIFSRTSSLRRRWATLGLIGNHVMELARVDSIVWNRELCQGGIRVRASASGARKAVVPNQCGDG